MVSRERDGGRTARQPGSMGSGIEELGGREDAMYVVLEYFTYLILIVGIAALVFVTSAVVLIAETTAKMVATSAKRLATRAANLATKHFSHIPNQASQHPEHPN